MKRLFIVLLAFAALLLAACSSDPDTIPLEPAPEYVTETENYKVIEHKNMLIGQDMPEWVTRYIADGVRGVEAMPIYKDVYVFIGEDKGSNLNALKQWVSGFSVAQDLARMVSFRVQMRFANAATGNPDDEYGRYFENVVKTVSDTSISGARKENDFWILKSIFKDDGKTVDREEYEYFVLVSVDKNLLQRQIDAVLDQAVADAAPTRDEVIAIERVKTIFYEGF
jgi:hypothetical protein